MSEENKPTFSEMIKGIDLLVRQGRAEYVLVDGKPGIRLIKKAEGGTS